MLCHTCETVPAVVMKKFGLAPLVKKEVFVAVIIIIAPDRAHRNACARLVDIGDTHLRRHVFECPVVHVVIETVLTSFATVCDIDVSPAVAVEINDGDSRAHRSDLRHDVIELGIKRRGLMMKINAGSFRHFFKTKAVA